MSRLVTFEIIMKEYEEAKHLNCFECAGLGYILEGESLDNLEATHCKCRRGRALQIATVDAKHWYYQVEHFHDLDFFDGSTEETGQRKNGR